ncbi:hypothetical protein XVE_4921, partial [Xanthomonas vesicatoria ATCC 35937]
KPLRNSPENTGPKRIPWRRKRSKSLSTDGPAIGGGSWGRYLSLLLVLLLGAVITIVVVSMFTGKSKQDAMRNAGIFLLGVPFALTPLTVPVTFVLFAYAAWRSFRPAARAHQ